MIDRDQLIEALAAVELVMRQDGYGNDEQWHKVRIATQWALDFPTDEQVEAAQDRLDDHDDAVGVLEAVRRVMFGGGDD